MSNDKKQSTLFDMSPAWVNEWKGMPAFNQEDQMPWQSIKVHFRNEDDRRAFAELIGQKITGQTQSVWYPKQEINKSLHKRYVSEKSVNLRYPVYIISKGRSESRLTAKALEAINVPYHIVIEPQEYAQYAAVISPDKILTLPFSNLGQGSIPARNWVWEHSISIGAERHWILDDNIRTFYRLNDNKKIRVADGSMLRAAEEFTDRYENVAMSGLNYQWFAKQKQEIPPYYVNTRVYSCILLRNDISHRWRGRYNEDTDLSLRILKDNLCTILFNAFLADKMTTMTMKGGNSDELYKDDGRLKMAQSLQEQHPDCVKITEKWGRPQHHVNYKIFRRNKLILKPGIVIPDTQDDYGMSLRVLTDAESAQHDYEYDLNADGDDSFDVAEFESCQ